MKGLGYFEKLSLAARWFLPREEAEGMIDDYQDILYEMDGPEEAEKRFGPPRKLVLDLAEPKKVRRWGFCFCLLLFLITAPCVMYFAIYRRGILYYELSDLFLCGALFFAALWVVLIGSYRKAAAGALTLLLAGFMCFVYLCSPTRVLTDLYNRLTSWHHIVRIGLPFDHEIAFFFLAAAVVSLVCFGFRGRPQKRMPGLLIAGLCLAVLAVVGIYGFCWYGEFVDMGLMLHLRWVKYGSFCAGGLCFAGALFSIVMARMADRRWRAVMILCLTGLALCFELQKLVWNWSPSLWQLVRDYEAGAVLCADLRPLNVQIPFYLTVGSVLAAIGLV